MSTIPEISQMMTISNHYPMKTAKERERPKKGRNSKTTITIDSDRDKSKRKRPGLQLQWSNSDKSTNKR